MFKFNLFALQSSKKALIDEFQKIEGVQFMNFNDESAEKFEFLKADDPSEEMSGLTDKITDVNFALKLVSEYAPKVKGLQALKEGKKSFTYDELEKSYKKLDYEKHIAVLKDLQKKLNLLGNEKNKLLGDIEALVPWLDLDVGYKDINQIEKCSIEIGTLPLKNLEKFEKVLNEHGENIYFEKVSEESNEVRIFVIASNDAKSQLEEALISNAFNKVNAKFEEKPAVEIKNLRDRVKSIEEETTAIESEIAGFAELIEDLHIAYEYLSAEMNEVKSYANFSKTDKIVMMEGWVSEDSFDGFKKIVDGVCGEYYHLETKEADEEENIPIKLKGNKFTEAFQGITEMYSMPSYKEVDPTPIFSMFYVIFFGMMLSDAAYGLIITFGTIFAIKKFNLNSATEKFLRLFTYLGISTTIWGIIYGGFFGDLLGKYLGMSYFQKPILNPQESIMTVMIMSVAFGIVHVYIGLGVKAYILIRDGKVFDAICDVFTWYAAVSGLILWLAGPMVGINGNIGMILAIIGLVGLLLTQGREAKSLGGKIGGGVYGLYGITSYVGDLVSYSRLMALGLATGFISNAFNLMINLFPTPVKFTLGIVLFAGLHAFNLGINALGAYVHTSRLQYLEFFNKFYEGGGKKFNPLKAESKYLEVVNSKNTK